MRNLLRLFLFILARVGLMLSIVMWIVGQWWGVTGTAKILSGSVRFVISDQGYAVGSENSRTLPWKYEVLSPEGVFEARWVFDPGSQDLKDFDCRRPLPGVVILYRGSRVLGSIRHSTVVVLVLIYYAMLKLAYRKRRIAMTPSSMEAKHQHTISAE